MYSFSHISVNIDIAAIHTTLKSNFFKTDLVHFADEFTDIRQHDKLNLLFYG